MIMDGNLGNVAGQWTFGVNNFGLIWLTITSLLMVGGPAVAALVYILVRELAGRDITRYTGEETEPEIQLRLHKDRKKAA